MRPQQFPALALLAALLLAIAWLPASAARADAGRWLNSPTTQQLRQEIAALQDPLQEPHPPLDDAQQQRLADLLSLEQAVAASDSRSQVRNAGDHNLALLTRSKKASAGDPPVLGVLLPGHESDDDFSVEGLLLPAAVGLEWGEASAAAATLAPRLIQLPEGIRLTVRSPVEAAPLGAAGDAPPQQTYRLSLPPFQLLDTLPDGSAVPRLSQADLDAQSETAPID